MGVVPKLDMEDSYVLVTAVRLAQLVFTGVVTGLTAALIKNTRGYVGIDVPGSVYAAQNFLMFCAIVNWFSAVYGLLSRRIQSLAKPMIQLPLDGAGTIFSLIGAIIISAKLGVVDCHKVAEGKTKISDDWIALFPYTDMTYDSDETRSAIEGKCRMFQADDVFFYVLFVSAALSLFFTFRTWKSGGGGIAKSGGIV
ncbi:non-classical export protein 2 [Zalerion maritima]|uniref:Non-classical export protein 2 n=1 Tax=Zalerion maritima TaxID=339359 RepID=A0AAD5WPV4_9PEZI|nr:non-classical export protein 2 [Zalerion maritima]